MTTTATGAADGSRPLDCPNCGERLPDRGKVECRVCGWEEPISDTLRRGVASIATTYKNRSEAAPGGLNWFFKSGADDGEKESGGDSSAASG